MSSDGDLHGARSYLYQLLQSLFGVEPSEGQLAVVAQGETAAACEAVGGESLRAVGERLAKAALEAALEDLHCTYNRLVGGQGVFWLRRGSRCTWEKRGCFCRRAQ